MLRLMTTPHGWQNLATQRHRVRDRDDILSAIQTVHEDATETEVLGGDYLAYWLGDAKEGDLIGFAWKADDVWFYAVMNRIALDVGVHCTLVIEGRKVSIAPTIRHKVETGEIKVVERDENAGLRQLEQNLRAAANAPRPKRERNVIISREVFREAGEYYALVETKTAVKQLGPFSSKRAAEEAQL